MKQSIVSEAKFRKRVVILKNTESQKRRTDIIGAGRQFTSGRQDMMGIGKV